MGRTEGGGSIGTSLGVDVVWDFSLLTRPCRGAALLLVVRVVVMQCLFTVGIVALKLSLGVDVGGLCLSTRNGCVYEEEYYRSITCTSLLIVPDAG